MKIKFQNPIQFFKDSKTEAQIKAEKKAEAKAKLAAAATTAIDVAETSVLVPVWLIGKSVKAIKTAYLNGAK